MAARVLEHSSAGDSDSDSANATASRLGQRIQSSSGRMARLIGQVLDISRLESGFRLPLQFDHVNLTRSLDDILDETQLAYPGTEVLREAPDTLLAWVDADRMSQVFSNLVSNARHHGAPGQPVVVKLSCEDERADGADGADRMARLEVRNVAPPIPEDQLASLFTAFMRQSGANARNKGGLGLGLHIAQTIVAAHGGDIAYRHEGRQVVFTVRFPVRRAPPA